MMKIQSAARAGLKPILDRSKSGQVERPPAYRVRLNKILNAIYTSPAGAARYIAMEGLRGVAILMVFVCHYDVLIVQHFNVPPSVAFFSSIVGRMATAGVDLFFLLSGFLIYRSAIRADFGYLRFLKKRIVRIYPTFLAVFIAYVGLSIALPKLTKELGGGWPLIRTIAENLAFLPGFVNVKPIVGVAWSLSYEWYFYVAAPLLVMLLRMHEWARSRRIALLVTTAVLYISVSALGPQLSEIIGVPIYRFHVRLVMFLVGMVVFEILESGWSPAQLQVWERGAIACTLVGFGALFLIEMVHGPMDVGSVYTPRFEAVRCLVLIAMFAPITLFSLGRNDFLNSLLITPELRWLGNISYSYYLIHTLAIDVVRVGILKLSVTHAWPLVTLWLLFPLAFSLTLVAAVALFVLVERRFSLCPISEGRKAHSGEVIEIDRARKLGITRREAGTFASIESSQVP
jgi:exopolysaccharide production protein ExoZ